MSQLRNPALERVGSGRGDLDRNDLPDERLRAVQVDDPEVRRAAGHASPAVDRLDQDLVRLPDERARSGGAAIAAGARSARGSRRFFSASGDVVRQAQRRRAGPRRVAEREQPVEADGLDERQRLVELGGVSPG